jgi:holo-[acyl-carrier protein] synthase
MIFGIGVDVLEAARVKKVYDRFGDHFIDRLLLPAERAQLAKTRRTERFLAMRFAAKEAKAMGTGFAHGIWIRDVGVVQSMGPARSGLFGAGEKMRAQARHRRRACHATDERG